MSPSKWEKKSATKDLASSARVSSLRKTETEHEESTIEVTSSAEYSEIGLSFSNERLPNLSSPEILIVIDIRYSKGTLEGQSWGHLGATALR